MSLLSAPRLAARVYLGTDGRHVTLSDLFDQRLPSARDKEEWAFALVL